MPTKAEALAGRRWYLVDAEGCVLGRLASEVAKVLRGKHVARFTPHLDTGDFVIVTNAARVRLTGRKLERKVYYRHSGYPGGIRSARAAERLAKNPTWLVREAVGGMLPKNRLGRQLATKLKVYAGPDHPHAAQKPERLELRGVKR